MKKGILLFICVATVLSLHAQTGVANPFGRYFGDRLKSLDVSGEVVTASFRVCPNEDSLSRIIRAENSAMIILEWEIPDKNIPNLEKADSVRFSGTQPFLWVWRTDANKLHNITIFRNNPGDWNPLYASVKVLPKDFRRGELFEIDAAFTKGQVSKLNKLGIPMPTKKSTIDLVCRQTL